MTEVIAIFLALALGLLVGLRVGAWRTTQLMAARRAAMGAAAGFARFLPPEVPERSAADILAGRIPVVLGGARYILPVLPRDASKEWLDALDERFAGIGAALEAARNDTPQIMSILVSQADGLLDMLLSYDQTDELPPREEINRLATDAEILRAAIEVWRAAHPLAATLATMSDLPTNGSFSGPLSSSPLPTDGRLSTSGDA